MAENRNITWNVKLVIKPAVMQGFKLSLTSNSLAQGKWGILPPALIAANGPETAVSFKAMGAACSATGTEGAAIYIADDNAGNRTDFAFMFNIPYSSANSGGVTISGPGSNNYEISGGNVPVSGSSVTVDVTITQIGPVS